MKGCYLFCLLDRYGAEIKARKTLVQAYLFALVYMRDQYSLDVTTIDELKSWVKEQRDVRIKFYYVDFATLDVREEL